MYIPTQIVNSRTVFQRRYRDCLHKWLLYSKQILYTVTSSCCDNTMRCRQKKNQILYGSE